MFKFLNQCFARLRFWESVSSKTAVAPSSRFCESETLFQNRCRAKHWFKNLNILPTNPNHKFCFIKAAQRMTYVQLRESVEDKQAAYPLYCCFWDVWVENFPYLIHLKKTSWKFGQSAWHSGHSFMVAIFDFERQLVWNKWPHRVDKTSLFLVKFSWQIKQMIFIFLAAWELCVWINWI